MIIEQKIMRNVSLTAHPQGCKQYVLDQIAYVESEKEKSNLSEFPKKVLIVGGSTGYGLSARIVSAIGGNAQTMNVSVEREPQKNKVATPGWYNSIAFEQEAHKRGLYATSVFGDAFSDATKREVANRIKEEMGQIDLLIYSVASPLRIDPDDPTKVYRSVIKPIAKPYSDLSVDVQSGVVEQATIDVADAQQVEETIKVMGGEDWKRWIDYLLKRELLAPGVKTVAFSYIGPSITYPIYREGSIGKAKEDLERTAFELKKSLKDLGGDAFVSVNKALVTRASSVIPVVPLYITILYKVMKEHHVHEDAIMHIWRLFSDRLYSGQHINTDEKGRIRVDDWEMEQQIQDEVLRRWALQKEGSVLVEADLEGFKQEYDNIHGFGYDSIDYGVAVDPTVV
ncbi:MAG: enoyl-ACP reductase FabV [Sphaerochaetaceae bacterium]|jgi:enoyl-[acyl-carrier protein] reductase/trans-2-enoyl-CoA reductase (NAD+)